MATAFAKAGNLRAEDDHSKVNGLFLALLCTLSHWGGLCPTAHLLEIRFVLSTQI
jgi:hypothetical protein